MDDIFEQMLSSSPWAGDGATINPSLLGGSLEMNRGSFYEDNGRLPNEVMMFDPGHVHAIQVGALCFLFKCPLCFSMYTYIYVYT